MRAGFSVDGLNEIARASHEFLRSDAVARHPAAVCLLAFVAQQIAAKWEGAMLSSSEGALIEAHLWPAMNAVLNCAESEGHDLILRLDELARAYSQVSVFF